MILPFFRNLEFSRVSNYHLALPLELTKLHNVFHVSMLRRHCSDGSHILSVQVVQVQTYFLYDEELKAILARVVKQLRNKQVPLVRVLWQHMAEKKLLGSQKQL